MRRRAPSLIAALVVAILAEALIAVAIGPTGLPPLSVVTALLHPFASGTAVAIVWEVRLPRVLAACLVGAGLAVAGLIFQAILRNALADPYLIGTSSGASLGATVSEIFFAGAGSVSAGAFVGASLAVLLSSVIARGRGSSQTITIVLVGYALSVILGAATMLLKTLHRSSIVSIYFWELGGLGSVTWSQDLLLLAALVLGLFGCAYFRHDLDALALGQRRAAYFGVHVTRVRLILLLLGGLVTAMTVSAAGLIGFVGLVAPHVARSLSGSRHARVLVSCAAFGSGFLLLCDTIARSLPFGEIPVGIVTAILGGPFFIWMLVRSGRLGGVDA